MKKFENIFKYLDNFGIKFHFYIDKRPKTYTIIGGILTLFSYILCLGLFTFVSLKKLNSSITTYILFNPKIELQNDKIFLPFKINSQNNKLYQNIKIYYSSTENNTNIKLIDFKTCNETSIKNTRNFYNKNNNIFPFLGELFCIDLGKIFNNNLLFHKNIILNIVILNEIESDCSCNKNNSFNFEVYYPFIEFFPNEFLRPLLIKYQKYSFNINNNTIKNEKLIFEEYSVLDKFGFLGTKEKSFSLWGTNSLSNENINGNNNVTIYSLNISFSNKKILYKRKQENIFSIFIDIFPICYIIFKFIKSILRVFILTESKSKIIEFLFEKTGEIENYRIDMNKSKMRFNSLAGMHNQNLTNNLDNKKINEENGEIIFKTENNNNSNIKNKINIERNNNLDRDKNFTQNKRNEKIKCYKNDNGKESHKNINMSILKLSKLNKKKSRRSVDFSRNIADKNESQNNNNLFLINQNILINKNFEDSSLKLDMNKSNSITDEKISPTPSCRIARIKKRKLFPYKFYFFSTFLKSYDIRNCLCLFSIKYKKVFSFVNQILDINSYLMLRKEFEILKNLFCNREDLALIENNKKINLNSTKFTREIKDCIDNNKFSIFFKKS